MTFKAVRILKEVALIFAEDTRKTSILLNHYDISCKLLSFHQANEHKVLEKAIGMIGEAGQAALVTDAGTPAISDPGYLLVRECIRQGIDVECLPGPTAFIPALVQSGLPADRFFFEGFLPHKKGRMTRLKFLSELDHTVILYESPHRILKTIEQAMDFFGRERPASVSRELTKVFEETIRGSLQELHQQLSAGTVKGEFVLIIEGKS